MQVEVKSCLVRNAITIVGEEAHIVLRLQGELHVRLDVVARLAIEQLADADAVPKELPLVSVFVVVCAEPLTVFTLHYSSLSTLLRR